MAEQKLAETLWDEGGVRYIDSPGSAVTEAGEYVGTVGCYLADEGGIRVHVGFNSSLSVAFRTANTAVRAAYGVMELMVDVPSLTVPGECIAKGLRHQDVPAAQEIASGFGVDRKTAFDLAGELCSLWMVDPARGKVDDLLFLVRQMAAEADGLSLDEHETVGQGNTPKFWMERKGASK